MWTEIFACLTTVPLLVCCWTKVIVPCTPNVLGNLCEKCLSCLGKKFDYKYNLEDNLGLLSGALDELQAVRDDVVRKVEDEVLKGGQEPRAVVTDWLSKVHTIETNTIQLIQKASNQGTSSQDAYGHGTFSQDASGQDAAGQNTSSQDASGHGISSQDPTIGCFSNDNTIQVIDEASSSGQGTSSQDASGQGDATSGCFSRCFCMDNISIVSVGEKVFKRIDEIRALSSKGTFEPVTRPAATHVVIERDAHQISVLKTFEKTFEKTWESLKKKRMLGIYGMGGVGKTTLLTLINNRFGDEIIKAEFDVVIWVKVSKDADVQKIKDDNENIQVGIDQIQDTIGERLGICDGNWSTYSNTKKAEIIKSFLTKKPRFVLLLDDLWEKVSLTTIGIPLQGKGYKIVFTTRSKDVCKSMEGDANIEVKCLAKNEAWNLFKVKSKCSSRNAEFHAVGKEIAAKCCGLPLALDVIGKAMASKKTLCDWKDALEQLKTYPIDFKGTKDIFHVLKFSYDNLKDDTVKSCFEYCALFPKAYNINRDELVEYWIGERIIDDKDGRQRARAKRLGDGIIDTLVEAGLLLEDDESEQKAYMHDMIGEMALWIVSKSQKGEKYAVQTDVGLSKLTDVPDWKTATKMSLMNNEIENIRDDPDFCGQACLITLFLQNNKLVDIVGTFFGFLSTLVVLDLSGNLNITNLPQEISILVVLRYLSLSGTMIKHLPCGLKKLTRLIHLDLEYTADLRSISLISELPKLQVLRFFDSTVSLDAHLMMILEGLRDLEVLTITVRKDEVVLGAFLESNLARKTHGLFLDELQVSGASFAAIGVLCNLHNLEMVDCDIVDSGIEWKSNRRDPSSPSTSSSEIIPSNTWFKSLSTVKLISCIHLKDLTWLVYAEKLESLSVESSPKMKEIISKEKPVGVSVEPFLNLQVLCLHHLGALKSIYWSPLAFPRLHQVRITNCLELHKLPFNSTSVEKIDDLRMEVEKEWFERLEWDDDARHRFLPFVPMASAV